MSWTDAMEVYAPGPTDPNAAPPVGVLPQRPSAALALRVHHHLPRADRDTYTRIETLAELAGATDADVRRALKTLRDAGFAEPHERGWRRTTPTTPTETTTMTTLTGEQARARRQAIGLSQGRLAKLARVSPGHLCSWEMGRDGHNLSDESAKRVEAALLEAEAARNTAAPSPSSAPGVGPDEPPASGEALARELALTTQALDAAKARCDELERAAEPLRAALEEARCERDELVREVRALTKEREEEREKHLQAEAAIRREVHDARRAQAAAEGALGPLRMEVDALRAQGAAGAVDVGALAKVEAHRDALQREVDSERWRHGNTMGRAEKAEQERDRLLAEVARLTSEALATDGDGLTAEQIAERCGLVYRPTDGRFVRGWWLKDGEPDDPSSLVVWEMAANCWLAPGCDSRPTEIAALRAYARARGVDLGAPAAPRNPWPGEDACAHGYGRALYCPDCRPAQPAPSGGTGDCWGELLDALPAHPLRAEMEARRALGVQRYGVPLGRGDGRDADRDLREELLDAAVYAQRLLGGPGEPCDLAVELLHIAQGPAEWQVEEQEHADRVIDEAGAVAAVLADAGIGPGPLPERVRRLADRSTWTARERTVWRAVLDRLIDADRDDLAAVIEALTGPMGAK